ncbi:GTP-binding protein [Coemansia brasiliensis]|uniref:GTP-binding protein n=1 Tax=Coemansia brasiliensis TaxID=2650707 RepID=A0A9W8IB05_9FUNG|nr:GTP-binding protein [Coemansia brasiliensis]
MTNQLDRNVVVLGGIGVAIQRFLGNEFNEKYQPTIKNTHSKKMTINQDETSLLDASYVGAADVYVIAFSVTFYKSFEIAKVIRDKILDMSGTETVAMVLVGNKSDLKDERQVNKADAEEAARQFGCPYIETSAKENLNIDQVFVNSIKIANRSRAGGDNPDELGSSDDKSSCIVM